MGLYLGKQRIIAINEKIATKQWVTDQGYLKNTNLSDYITNEQLQPVSDKIDDVSAKVEDISTKIIKKGTLGTINGKSIENGNNITIDLNLFKVVDQLPVSDIDVNKIYLLPNPAGADNNTYIEYAYIDSKWEVVGEYKSELSLDNYYTKEQTDEKFLTKAEVGNLADYVKNGELDTKVSEAGYVKTDALTTTLTTYAKKTDIPTVPTKLSELVNDSSYITTYTETDPVWNSEKVNYYTKTEIDGKNYLTEHQSLADYVKTEALTTALTTYAKKTELPTKLSELTNDSGFITTYTETDPVWTSEKVNYYTKTEIDEKNYLTEHQSLADYAKKSEIPTDYVRNTELTDYATLAYVSGQIDSIMIYVTEQIGSINSVLENI